MFIIRESHAALPTNSMFPSIDSAQLPSCSCDRAVGLQPRSPPCCTTPRVCPFFQRAFTERSATRDCRNWLTICSHIFVPTMISLESLILRAGVSSRSGLLRSDFLLCWCVIQRFVDYHRISTFLLLIPAFSACLNAHILPSVQFPV